VLRQRYAKELDISPAFIKGMEQRGLIYFTWEDCPYVGAQCSKCHCIVWTDSRSNPTLTEPKPRGVDDSGPGYTAYYHENMRRFLKSVPKCPSCGASAYDHFINNVQWPRFADGSILSGDPGLVEINQDPTKILVWEWA